jgi:hypothetical protein
MGGAITVLAFASGLGLALMGFGLFPAGMILSALGAGGALWIYWPDLRNLRLRLVTGIDRPTPLYSEIWIILIAILIGVGTPGYVYVRSLVPPTARDFSRHLEDEQKNRMRPELQLSANEAYSIEFNSVQNCDECEDYAQELRDFVGTFRGGSLAAAS